MTTIIPKVSQLSPRVIRILGCNPGPMTLQGTNTYLIGTGKRRVLLDTGESGIQEYTLSLKTVLKEEEVELSHVVITHWHPDHVGGLRDLIRSGIEGCKLMKIARKSVSDPNPATDVRYEFVEDGYEINTEGASLRVLHTPGHSEDHMAVLLTEENAIFSGDCILGEGTAVFEDLHTYMSSLERILELKPTVIYPGHGPVIEDCIPKIREYIDHRMAREKQVLDVLKTEPSTTYTLMELVKVIYKDTPEHLHTAASYNLSQHLAKLQKDGKVGIYVLVQTDHKWKVSDK